MGTLAFDDNEAPDLGVCCFSIPYQGEAFTIGVATTRLDPKHGEDLPLVSMHIQHQT